jgi:hypothetical protein
MTVRLSVSRKHPGLGPFDAVASRKRRCQTGGGGRPGYYFDPVVFALLAIRFCTRVLRAADFIIVRRAAAWTCFEAAIAWRDSAVADIFV